MMRKLYWILFLMLIDVNNIVGQGESINLGISARVDTNNSDIKSVIDVWRTYLNSRPDSLYDNICWSYYDKKSRIEFDLSRGWIYQNARMIRKYPPNVLSVERENENYIIRTLFCGWDSEHSITKPLSVFRVYAIKEAGTWKLKSALPFLTNGWMRQKVGDILYICNPSHLFNLTLAKKTSSFMDSVSRSFEMPSVDSIQFYICSNKDELAEIIGLDYYLGPTLGRTYKSDRLIFSANNSEWYPHEIIHIMFSSYKAHPLLDEGIATWLGGSESLGGNFNVLCGKLYDRVAKDDSTTFEDVIERWSLGALGFYTTGAILCQMSYEKGGINNVKQLLTIGNTSDDLYISIEKLFRIQRNDLVKNWKYKLKEYSNIPNK